jgi:hypothetical protein
VVCEQHLVLTHAQGEEHEWHILGVEASGQGVARVGQLLALLVAFLPLMLQVDQLYLEELVSEVDAACTQG